MITARLGNRSQTVMSATEHASNGPAVLTISAPIALSTEDLVAALYRWEGTAFDELDDDAYVRELVVESVVNGGLESIATAAGEMRQARPGTFAHDWLTTCQRAVARVFGP